MKFLFRTPYQKHVHFSNIGSRFAPQYSASYDKSGVLVLEQVGETDIYAEIQSYAESVDINLLIKRFMNGETDVLSRVQGFYEDVSDMPKNYQDVLNSVIHAEQFFDSLPASVKENFNNSFSEFLVSAGQADFMDNFVSSDSQDSSQEDSSDVSSSNGGDSDE